MLLLTGIGIPGRACLERAMFASLSCLLVFGTSRTVVPIVWSPPLTCNNQFWKFGMCSEDPSLHNFLGPRICMVKNEWGIIIHIIRNPPKSFWPLWVGSPRCVCVGGGGSEPKTIFSKKKLAGPNLIKKHIGRIASA